MFFSPLTCSGTILPYRDPEAVYLSEYVDSFISPDDFTIVFNFKSVYTAALYDIANQIIVPEHIWKDVTGSDDLDQR